MKIIPDLKEGEAVEFDGSFLINLTSGTYEIDGSELTVHYGGRQIMVSSMDVIYRITKSNPVHIGFKKDGKPFGDFDEWKRLSALNRQYREDGYPSLDEEFRLRSELRKYEGCDNVMSVPEIVKTKIDIPVIAKFIDTGSEFIDSALHVGSLNFHGRGAFKVKASAIAMNEAMNLMKEYPSITRDSTHSNIRYLKHNGSYIFNSVEESKYAYVKDDNTSWIVASLEDAKKKEAEVRKVIRTHILLKVNPTPVNELPPATLKELLSSIDNALSQVRILQPMKNSRSEQTHAITYLNKARDMLLTAVESNESTVPV